MRMNPASAAVPNVIVLHMKNRLTFFQSSFSGQVWCSGVGSIAVMFSNIVGFLGFGKLFFRFGAVFCVFGV